MIKNTSVQHNFPSQNIFSFFFKIIKRYLDDCTSTKTVVFQTISPSVSSGEQKYKPKNKNMAFIHKHHT